MSSFSSSSSSSSSSTSTSSIALPSLSSHQNDMDLKQLSLGFQFLNQLLRLLLHYQSTSSNSKKTFLFTSSSLLLFPLLQLTHWISNQSLLTPNLSPTIASLHDTIRRLLSQNLFQFHDLEEYRQVLFEMERGRPTSSYKEEDGEKEQGEEKNDGLLERKEMTDLDKSSIESSTLEKGSIQRDTKKSKKLTRDRGSKVSRDTTSYQKSFFDTLESEFKKPLGPSDAVITCLPYFLDLFLSARHLSDPASSNSTIHPNQAISTLTTSSGNSTLLEDSNSPSSISPTLAGGNLESKFSVNFSFFKVLTSYLDMTISKDQVLSLNRSLDIKSQMLTLLNRFQVYRATNDRISKVIEIELQDLMNDSLVGLFDGSSNVFSALLKSTKTSLFLFWESLLSVAPSVILPHLPVLFKSCLSDPLPTSGNSFLMSILNHFEKSRLLNDYLTQKLTALHDLQELNSSLSAPLELIFNSQYLKLWRKSLLSSPPTVRLELLKLISTNLIQNHLDLMSSQKSIDPARPTKKLKKSHQKKKESSTFESESNWLIEFAIPILESFYNYSSRNPSNQLSLKELSLSIYTGWIQPCLESEFHYMNESSICMALQVHSILGHLVEDYHSQNMTMTHLSNGFSLVTSKSWIIARYWMIKLTLEWLNREFAATSTSNFLVKSDIKTAFSFDKEGSNDPLIQTLTNSLGEWTSHDKKNSWTGQFNDLNSKNFPVSVMTLFLNHFPLVW